MTRLFGECFLVCFQSRLPNQGDSSILAQTGYVSNSLTHALLYDRLALHFQSIWWRRTVTGRIFILDDKENLTPMEQAPYDSERLLKEALGRGVASGKVDH